MNKIGIGIGLTAISIGLALMVSGQRMCRTSCWVDDVFKLLLPKDYEFLAGGMPSPNRDCNCCPCHLEEAEAVMPCAAQVLR